MKRILYISLLLFICSALLSMAQKASSYPIYYMETPHQFIEIEELPRDTIHDTIYVSDMDVFFKEYSGCNLNEFTRRYGHIKAIIDSLNTLSEERLYYNFFLPRDTSHSLSNRFVVKEFQVYSDTTILYGDKVNNIRLVENSKSIRKEILFRCTGEKTTRQLIKSPETISQVISALFTEMQKLYNDSIHIEGINLYFPDFNFKEKRAMAQFVKSVRIIMDASKNFKYPQTRLNVTFNTYNGEKMIDRNYQYCMLQDASEVISLDYSYPIDSCYLKGYRLIRKANMTDISLISQIINHFYIARFYMGNLNKDTANLTDFSEYVIDPYLKVDFLDNQWEIYFFILIGILFLTLVFIILYIFYKSIPDFINHNIETVLIISIVIILEIIALAIIIFQNLNQEDDFMLMDKNPLILFSLPSLIILIIPVLRHILKKKRIP